MVNAQTIAKAIIEVGATGVDVAEAEIEALEVKLQLLEKTYNSGNITLTAYAKRTEAVKAELAGLRGGVEMAADATAKFNTKQEALDSLSKKSAGGMKNMQMGMLELSRAFEDSMYGIRGVLNNIPTTIQMFGGPAGLAAGVSATAVAFTMLQKPIEEFLRSLSQNNLDHFTNSLDSFKRRIEELSAKSHKVQIDFQMIDEAEKRVAGIEMALRRVEALRHQQTTTQERVGKAVSEAIVEHAGGTDIVSGTENLEKLVRKARGADLAGADMKAGELEKTKRAVATQLRLAEAPGLTPEMTAIALNEAQKLKEKVAALDHEIQGRVKEQVGVIVGQAAGGIDKQRLELIKIFDENEKLFREGVPAEGITPVAGLFRHSLEQASPEIVREKDKEKDFIDNQKRMAHLDKALKLKGEKDARDAKQKQAEHDRAEGEKAAPIISAFVKGKNLDDLATGQLRDLEKAGTALEKAGGKPMNAQEQLEFLQATIKKAIEGELKSRGLLNASTSKAAGTTATQLAAHAREALDKEQAKANKFKGHPQKSVEAANKEEADAIKASGVNLMTEQLLAQGKAQGGFADNAGRFHKMNPEQIFNAVHAEVMKYLHRQIGVDKFGRPIRANAGMGREETSDLATRITSGANKDLTAQLAGMSGQSLTNQEKLIEIVGELGMTLAAQRQKLAAQGQRIDFLQRGARAERQRNNPPGPTNLPMGDQR